MTDALTVLRDIMKECHGAPGAAWELVVTTKIARLEREQAEAKPICLHLNVTHTTNVVTGGFGGSFCRDCNAKVDQVWRTVP